MGSIARNGILARSKKRTGQINLPPAVDAGVNQVITLPTNSVSVIGTATDSGTIVSTLWTQVSGPSTASIINPILLTTTISNLVVGTYVFRLTATDNQGASSSDSVTIIVNAAIPVNVPPIANAGPDQNIQLPSNVILTGSATDSDGTIVSYLWTRVSGPNTPTINTPSNAVTSVSGLAEGTYVFRLTVTDNNGATDTDDTVITVFPIVILPTLNAEIALVSNPTVPITTIGITTPATLNLISASTASVTIGVYQWTKVSGPTCTISNPNSNSTTITGLVTGTYVFRLQIWLATPWESYTDTQDLTVTVSTTTSPTFYVDSISGSDSNDGTTELTAWRTTNKVNAALVAGTIQAGNSVLFKRSQIHYGFITITRSGTSDNPITFGAYGVGLDPILSGFSSVTSWVSVGTNLWESSSAIGSLSTCNIIFINGVNTPYGKMPKSGYYTISSATATSIASASLNSATINWTGADVASRTARWHIDRAIVSSHSGNTIAFPGMSYNPVAGWGFFLQNHIKACTAQNDWCYNSTTKKITIYSTTSPTNVKAPTLDIGVNLNNYNHIKITNLKFEGYNSYGVFANLSDAVSNTGITVQNCTFNFIGKIAIYTNRRNSNGISVTNNTITECNDGGIHVGSTNDAVITDNTMTNTGNLLGMGLSGDESYTGIVCFAGSNCKVYRNKITNAGYNGIRWDGDGTEIVNNTVIHTNYIKDDGGGIYNFPNNGDDTIDTHTKRRLVKGNIVIDAPGNNEGSISSYLSLEGYAIYNDGNSSDTDFVDNFCYNDTSTVGCFFMNGGYNNVANNNILLGGQRALRSHVVSGITPLAHQYVNNTYIAKESNQYPIYMEISSIPSSWTLSGNRYAKPTDDNSAKIWIDKSGVDEYFTLAAYKALPFVNGKDQDALNSVITVSNSSKIVYHYNETAIGKTIALGSGVYRDARDGSTKTGNIILQPYTGIVLLDTA